MSKYALVYAGGAMAQTPEAQQASMDAWNGWFASLGDAIVDGGNPFGSSASISADGVTESGRLGASVYSLVTANSLQDAVGLAKGCPIIADRLYGTAEPGKLLHLHSRRIVLPLQKTKPPIVVEAPPPPHMLEALTACGFSPAP